MICNVLDMEVYPELNARVYTLDTEIYPGNDIVGVNLGPQLTAQDAIAIQKAVGPIKTFVTSLHKLQVILFVIFEARKFTIRSTSTNWAEFEPKIFNALEAAYDFEVIRISIN